MNVEITVLQMEILIFLAWRVCLESEGRMHKEENDPQVQNDACEQIDGVSTALRMKTICLKSYFALSEALKFGETATTGDYLCIHPF